ncbi:MAG TPA: serine hydroxymethyltransferase [Candidatus Thermoplasmatota archaeon]|nr:serine hydroxymethyltransferase [Candidatus Thermoplasmatota archaeon]
MSAAHRKDAEFVLHEVERHHAWFDQSIPLIASENLISPLARRMLVSDFHDRYAEGHPGKRYYQGLIHIDAVERKCKELALRLFDCTWADVRCVSGTEANIAAFAATTKPGDLITAVSTADGGHISHAKFGGAGVRGLAIETYPWDAENMVPDVQGSVKLIREKKPKLCVIGQSMFLFPTPMRDIAAAAHEVGAVVMYDGAHVMGLIAGKRFQDPLREGADFITGSTHKTLPGPQGALILGNFPPEAHEEQGTLARKLDRAVFPGTVSSHHLHHLAAKAVALAEHLDFGQAYADQVIRNAKALAQALHEKGVAVLGEKRGFTESHQVVVDVKAHGGGAWAAQALEDAGLITNMNMLPGDTSALHPSGLRLGSQEMTRIGMREADMREVAQFLVDVVVRKEKPADVKRRVAEFRARFKGIHYCYDEGQPAYRFWKLA